MTTDRRSSSRGNDRRQIKDRRVSKRIYEARDYGVFTSGIKIGCVISDE